MDEGLLRVVVYFVGVVGVLVLPHLVADPQVVHNLEKQDVQTL